MSATTSIQWTDRTWNPVRGCSLVSDGCRNCYAMKVAHRFSNPGGPYEGLTEIGPSGPRWNGKIRTVDAALMEPLRWKKPQRIFVNSMSDLFHPDVPYEFIVKVFAVMGLAYWHEALQVLTKRADRMREVVSRPNFRHEVQCEAEAIAAKVRTSMEMVPHHLQWPLPNVWLGVSCENQQTADERIPLLLQTPTAMRFISAEPLLSGIDIAKHRPGALGLHWCIVGGESGPNARPCQMWWIRNLVGQCRDAGVTVFVKQLGSSPEQGLANAPSRMMGLGLRDRKGGDPSEWPEDLRIRAFPITKDVPHAHPE